jgi:hypothetical protein
MRVSRYVIGMMPNATALRLRISSIRTRCRGQLSSSLVLEHSPHTAGVDGTGR